MAEITAAAVKALRERTGLPMMDCKKALAESQGDEEAAVQWLRERGLKLISERAGRETAFGTFGLFTSREAGAIVELKCESAPVAANEDFKQLAADLARQLATGPGAATADELLSQPSPSKGTTLQEQKDHLFNRIREVFNVGRLQKFDGACAGYVHPGARVLGVLLEVEGGPEDAARDVAMHIAALRPVVVKVEELDKAAVEKERQILRSAALAEGKPENIVDKMVEGRLRKEFYVTQVLEEQPFVKEETVTVGQFAEKNKMKLKRFVCWELGKE
ncbi:MAG: translation elongation factor Ts [Planctomycetes bacterium]|nr:translation elongation factor Ts [Planctomycetota bacterium]